jgi:hypothetical protein
MRRLLALALGLCLLAGSVAALELRPAGPSYLPWRICRATLEDEAGMTGPIRVFGLDWKGASSLLFETRDEAWARSRELAFYLDEGVKLLRIEAEGPAGKETIEVDLAAEAAAAPLPGEAELARRGAMRGLDLPFPRLGFGRPPEHYALASTDLEAAAIAATESLFRAPPPAPALLCLGLFVLAAALLASLGPALGRPAPSRRAFLGLAGLALLASLAIVLLLPSRPALYLLRFPETDSGGTMAARLDLTTAALGGYDSLTWEGGRSSHTLAAFSTPGGSSLPLTALVAEGEDCRFSQPPLIVPTEAGFELRASRLTLAWIVHERR